MVEVKSTKGIERNMHDEITNLVRKAYTEGREDGMREHKTITDCSWEKGAKDAWDCIINLLNSLGKDEDIKSDDRAVMRAVAHTLETTDAVGHTKSFVSMRNLMTESEEDEDKPIEVGDVVLDKSGNECVVTNTDTHIHVIYPSNGKTMKWDKRAEFKQTGKRVLGMGKVEV